MAGPWAEEDDLVEVTPRATPLRMIFLKETDRKRPERQAKG